MVLLRTIRTALLLCAILGMTLPVYARPLLQDTTPVCGGTIELDQHLGFGLGGQANLLINDLVITGTMFNFMVTPDCNHGGAVCLRGTQVQLPATHITEDGFNVGSVSVNGVPHPQIYFLGEFNIVSPPVIIPRASAVSGTVTMRAPFSISGTLLGCLVPVPSGFCSQANTVFDTNFAGSGTVTYRLRALKGLDPTGRVARYSYDLQGVKFQFSN